MTENRIVYGLPRAEYDRVDAANFSTLRHIARSPAHYRDALLAQQVDTTPKKLGRVVHIACLEPERYPAECAVWREGRRAGKKWEAFQAEHAGRELITEKEERSVQMLQRAVRADAVAAPYLAKGKSEVSLFWTHQVADAAGLAGYRLKCKGRVDFEAAAGALVDLKTTRNASPGGFGREVWNYRYHVQAAYYSDAYALITGKRLPYIIVAVEATAPHVVVVYRVPDVVLEAGRNEYRALLDRLHYCRSNNVWDGYATGELELELPKWAMPWAQNEDDVSGLGLDFDAAQESA